MCPHMKKLVACMEIYLESVKKIFFQCKLSESEIGTYSVGDGTDSIVKLSTICGNLSE